MAAQRNFDEFYADERAFIIGGGTFHWRPIHWREWGELIDQRAADETKAAEDREKKIEALLKKKGNTLSRSEAEDIVDDEKTLVQSFEDVIDRICVYLEPGDVERFRETLNDKGKHISIAQLNELMVWLQGVQTPDRPTETPSSSSSGPGTQGAISPAA